MATRVATAALLQEIRVENFRNARRGTLRPGPICAFIGEPGAGPSNLLFALRALLDPSFDLSTADITEGARTVSIEASLADGRTVSLKERDGAPPIVHFPVSLRETELVAADAAVHGAVASALAPLAAQREALVTALEACRASRPSGVVYAIEEPELFLAPHEHRYLRRVIQRLAEAGNQIFFTTHAPGLLSVAALEEVNLVSRDEVGITTVERLRPIDVDDTFRAMCEFDAERSELLLARAAILVEGMTEKVTMPFVFHALGHDADREQISIVECGGKANLPLFIEICKRARVPYVVVHDSDMRPGREPVISELKLNKLIRRLAGARRTVLLEPDFEAVAGYRSSRRGHKPAHAWRRISAGDVPEPLERAVRLALRATGRY
jgi:predicted ATP-dependent endonuclease of OLD family